MENSVVAVKVYNGTYVPVLDATSSKKRRLVLTTVRDNQTHVKIDLFRGSDEQMADAEYVASLVIDNIVASPKGEPDISLLLGMDENGNLNATATDTSSGEYQSLSVGMESLEPGGSYDIPDFELNDEELTLDDLSLDEDEFSLDEEPAGGSGDLEADSDLDLESITFDDVGVELPSPEENLPTDFAVAEISTDDSAMEDDLELAGLPDFSDDAISFDESLGTEEVVEEDDNLFESAEEPQSEEMVEELTLDHELSLSADDEETTAGDVDFEEEVELAGPIDEAEVMETPAVDDTEIDEGMVEADLGEEDFTFDEEEEISFDETPGSGFGDEFDEALEGDVSDASVADFGEEMSDFGDEDLSADEFDRLDSAPVGAADAEESAPVPRRSNAFIFVGYLLLSLSALGVITYFVFRLMEGPATPPLRAAALAPILMSPIVSRRRRKRTR